jgi:ribosomal-protein-alanine N-acetyltransferase
MSTDQPRVHGFELRALDESDAPGLLALFSDPEVCAFMDIEPLQTEFEALDIIDWAQAQAAQGVGVRWGVRRPGASRLIGTVGYNRIERSRGRWGEIAYDLARDQWGRGVMSAILPAVIARGFEDWGLIRLEAMVTEGNERSCALLRRMGFHQEGLLARRGYWKCQAWDQLVFARLAD